jgi:hypothetical protein
LNGLVVASRGPKREDLPDPNLTFIYTFLRLTKTTTEVIHRGLTTGDCGTMTDDESVVAGRDARMPSGWRVIRGLEPRRRRRIPKPERMGPRRKHASQRRGRLRWGAKLRDLKKRQAGSGRRRKIRNRGERMRQMERSFKNFLRTASAEEMTCVIRESLIQLRSLNPQMMGMDPDG